MTILFDQRGSDSPFIETVTWGRTIEAGTPLRPAETHWHMVFVRYQGRPLLLVVGPLTASGLATYAAGAEILWIKLKLGAFMPHLPPRNYLDLETILPGAGSRSFWLKDCAWQYPNEDNVETFIHRLAHDDVLVRDPLVEQWLQVDSEAIFEGYPPGQPQHRPPEISPRTVRHHFLQATGLTHAHIRQFDRAQRAAALLQQGIPILDVVDRLGYFDQPHLTRSLKRFNGATPAQLLPQAGFPITDRNPEARTVSQENHAGRY